MGRLGTLAVAVFRDRAGEQSVELLLQVGQVDPVLRPLGAGDAGHDAVEIELDHLAVVAGAGRGDAEHPLRHVVGTHQVDLLRAAPGGEQVAAGLLVDREEAHRRAILRRHVGDGRAVGGRERPCPLAVELDELADDLGAPEQFGHAQDEVGRGDALAQRALEADADHIGGEEVDRLPEHAGLGFDAADAPADDAETVDHRGVRIRADERVGEGDPVALQDAAGEVLEVHLVADADARGDDAEGVEGLHAPLEELVALAVALEFEFHVALERVGATGDVDLHRVVDDEVDRHERLDDLRVLAELRNRRAHRGQVDEQRHAGEVLEQDAGDDEGDFLGPFRARLPRGQRANVLLGDLAAVAVAQHGLEHDPDADREARDRAEPGLLELRQRLEAARAAPVGEGLQGVERGGIRVLLAHDGDLTRPPRCRNSPRPARRGFSRGGSRARSPPRSRRRREGSQ